ncbi:MAG: RHS repeat domain-containing protein [Candidatus Binatia bacterium]
MAYTYDAWARLKTATAGPTASPTWKLGWDYDRYGNRKNQNVLAGSAPAPQLTINESTNRITDPGYTYDPAGNLTNDTVNQYTFDAENRVTEVRDQAGTLIATYSYDGSGSRVKKVAGATTTVYLFSGTRVIAEYINGSLNKEYIYTTSELLATIENGVTKYHHRDHLSARVITDESGNVVAQQGEYPFGEAWYQNGQTSKWAFTNYERDAESGLDYAGFRYYSSRLGRFMSTDPIAGSIVNPQRLNLYAYVGNDPINRADPLGLDWFDQLFSAQYHGFYGNGTNLGLWIMESQTAAWMGYSYYDLPGNWDPLAQEELRHEWIIRTGLDPAGLVGNTPEEHFAKLKKRLKKALQNPECAALVGTENVNRLLDEFNPVEVTPQNIGDVFKRYSDDFDPRELARKLLEVATGAGPTPRTVTYAFTGFNIGDPIFYGWQFQDQSISAQATLVMHEFVHQTGQKKHLTHGAIAEVCGTEVPMPGK